MKNCIFILFVVASIVLLDSCKTTEVNCIKPYNQNQIVRWGEYNAKLGNVIGYQISTDMMISRIKKDKADTAYSIQEIGKVDPLKYCDIVEMIKYEVLRSQAVNAPGELNRFIEYQNPAKNVSVRAMWNSLFNTVGTKGFREIYDSMMVVSSTGVLPIKK